MTHSNNNQNSISASLNSSHMRRVLVLAFFVASSAIAGPQGWAQNDELLFVKEAADNNYSLGPVDILSNLDWEEMIALIGNSVSKTNDKAEIDRNFKEMLVATEFRESIEMKNGEF